MGYVIAAYAVTIGAVALYGLHLARERRAVARRLGPAEGAGGASPEGLRAGGEPNSG